MNGNEAHLLDERLRFGSASSLTSVSRVMPPANHQMRLFNKWKIAASVLFQILTKWNLLFCVTMLNWVLTIICAFILPAHYLKLPVAFLAIIPFASGQVFRRQIGNFSAPGVYRLVGFPYHAENIIRSIAWLSYKLNFSSYFVDPIKQITSP